MVLIDERMQTLFGDDERREDDGDSDDDDGGGQLPICVGDGGVGGDDVIHWPSSMFLTFFFVERLPFFT